MAGLHQFLSRSLAGAGAHAKDSCATGHDDARSSLDIVNFAPQSATPISSSMTNRQRKGNSPLLTRSDRGVHWVEDVPQSLRPGDRRVDNLVLRASSQVLTIYKAIVLLRTARPQISDPFVSVSGTMLFSLAPDEIIATQLLSPARHVHQTWCAEGHIYCHATIRPMTVSPASIYMGAKIVPKSL